VTSLTKAAASQRVTGIVASGGTGVNVLTTIGVNVGPDRESVGVGESCVATAAWVDMPSSVCAADVYNAFRVAAGCGVDAVNWLQASVAVARARIGIRIFLVLLLSMGASRV
jgi:hypothetical protein